VMVSGSLIPRSRRSTNQSGLCAISKSSSALSSAFRLEPATATRLATLAQVSRYEPAEADVRKRVDEGRSRAKRAPYNFTDDDTSQQTGWLCTRSS
jgi:hypothetical protein